jgi:hypothetical protein
MNTTTPQTLLGHNNPPSDIENLEQKLREDHDLPLSRAQALVEAADRVPSEIEDAETAAKATDYIKQVAGMQKAIEAIRTAEKEPYLKLGNFVHGFFKSVDERLDNAKKKAKTPLDNYLKREADKERRRREEEAAEQRRKAEEERLAAEALAKAQQSASALEMSDQAVISEQAAAKLETAAAAKPAELAKSRSAGGAVASLRTWWVGEVVDLEKLDLEVLRYHIKPDALKSAVTSFVNAGGRELAGAEIFEKSETVVR